MVTSHCVRPFFGHESSASRAVATLKPVLRSHVGVLSAGAWNKHEESVRAAGLLRRVDGVGRRRSHVADAWTFSGGSKWQTLERPPRTRPSKRPARPPVRACGRLPTEPRT